MSNIVLGRTKSIHILLIFSLICSFFIVPVPAKAGFLSNVWSKLRPVTKIAGNIGGAVAGATMASAFLPPLGTIIGGIGGWIVGGMIANHATKSLSNLVGTAAGVAGAIALGPGFFGIVGGFLLGDILGKIAYKLIDKADEELTGGVVFSQASEIPAANVSADSQAIAPSASIDSMKTSINNSIDKAATTIQNTTRNLEDKAKDTKENLIRAAQEKYEDACRYYNQLVEKAEKSELIVKAKKAMDDAKAELEALFRK